MIRDIRNIFYDLMVGSNSPSFWRMFVMALICSVIINMISHYVATLALLKMSDKKRNISRFILGLVVLYSFAPSIKMDFVYGLGDVLELKFLLFYVLHLCPLYIVFYLLIYSFIGIDTFALSGHYGIKASKFSIFLLKKTKISFILFSGFMLVNILFDDTKSILDSSLFKFRDIEDRNPVLTQVNPKLSMISHVSPILLLIIFLLVVFLIWRKALAKKLMVNRQTTANTMSFSLGDSHFFRDRKIDWSQLLVKLVGYIPYFILTLFIVFYSLKYMLQFKPFPKMLFILTNNLTYSYVICTLIGIICAVALHFSKLYYLLFSLLLCTALIPQSIIGYIMSTLIDSSGDSSINVRLFISYLLSFGIFPFYFFSTFLKENKTGFDYSFSVGGWSKRIKHIRLISKEPFRLSLGLLLLLTINDSMILGSISYASPEQKSFASTLYNLQMNTTSTSSLEFLNGVTWLILVNIFVVIFLPRLFELRSLFKKLTGYFIK